LLIEGPAGTGKTFGILAWLHTLSCQLPLRVLICRQTRTSLTESVLATFEDDVLPVFGHEFLAVGEQRKHRTDYQYPGGAKWVLGGLDKPDRILSTAWDIIFVNEAIETQVESWEALRGRTNRPGRDPRFGFLLGDTNPGDPAHFLNQRCDEGRTTRWQTGHAANPALYTKDGWTPAWKPFRDNLTSLTGSRLKRFFLGIWAVGEGSWFGQFDPESMVTTTAEFDTRWPVHLAVDTGVHTGAVFYQIRGEGDNLTVAVFADYYSCDVAADANARQILAIAAERCRGAYDVGRMDPAGGARSGFGSLTIAAEFERCGLRLQPWIKFPGCVLAGLNLLGSFIDAGRFQVHPRCTATVTALANYKRAKRGNQFIDEPEDPQHPHEEIVDSLRSSLLDKFPEGRRPVPRLTRINARRVL
jgi:hypothetical protein